MLALRAPLRKHKLPWPPVCSPRQHTNVNQKLFLQASIV